jgi:hypothetical protein
MDITVAIGPWNRAKLLNVDFTRMREFGDPTRRVLSENPVV